MISLSIALPKSVGVLFILDRYPDIIGKADMWKVYTAALSVG